MQDNSFESINLEDYTLDVSDFFSDYIIQEEKTKQEYVVFKGVMKNSPQAVKIYKRVFPNDAEAKQRFKVLMTAFHQGIVLADNIFLSFENDQYYIYVVEPWFQGYQDKFVPLSDLLKLDLDYIKKQRLFQNLVIIVKSLHTLGVAHLEISPKNIWIEDQFLVYLRPFKLKFESTNLLYTKKMKNSKNSQSIADSRSWYMAPEQTIKDFKQINYADPDSDDSFSSDREKGFHDFASDMWAMGCVFAEMFVSLTPVFQSVDTFDRIIRFFEVLGIPKKEDVFYMSQELYDTILEHLNSRIYNDNEFPLISELVKSLSKSEAKVLTSLLLFNPNKRPRCEILIQFPFFKSYVPEKHRNSIDYIAQNDIEETVAPSKQSAIKNSISKTHNDSMKEPSTVYQMDNSHDTSIRNTSNWWNIDPIITPKDPYLGNKEQTHYHNKSEVINLNNQKSGSKQKDQNLSYNAGRMSAKPDLNSERTKTPVQKRNDTSYQNESQILKSNYRSQPTKDSTHLRIDSNFPSIPIPPRAERASTTTNQTAKNSARLESTRVLPEEKQNEYRSEKVADRLNSTRSTHRGDAGIEKENRGSTINVNVSQRKDSVKPTPKARFAINIEVLKNLASHNVDGSYSCRIDIKTTKSSENEAVNLFSHFAPVKDRAAKMDFTGELDLECEPLLQTYKDKPLKILVFYRGSPKKQKETSTDLFLYGVAEVDLTLLFMNPQELIKGKEAPRRLTGWYHIYDAEDNYRTMGQMKIGIQLQVSANGFNNSTKHQQRSSISPLNQRVEQEQVIPKHDLTIDAKVSQRIIAPDDIETRKSERARIIDKENIRYSTLNTQAQYQSQAKDRSPITRDKSPLTRATRTSVLPERSSILKPKNYARDITPTRSTVGVGMGTVLNLKTTKVEPTNNIFSAIENDLAKLNEELKFKENLMERTANTSKKNSQYNDDFAHTLQKLRQILEGEEDFNY